MSNLTKVQLADLKKEYVEFIINEMSHKDMYEWIRNVMMHDIQDFDLEELKIEIDEYDDNLYEVLLPYTLNEEDSWEIMQEFKSDRAMLDFLNRGDD